MADVRPFRGVRYNPTAVDLSLVIAPPYDVIRPDEQRALHQRSPHNIVRLELGFARPTDSERDNIYTRAAALLAQWLQEGVLLRDPRPAFYLLEERYAQDGAELSRTTLFAAVRLEEYEKGVVLPHEHTRPAPKEDRLRLMTACCANLSPIMALYRDPGGLKTLLSDVRKRRPVATCTGLEGRRFSFWVVDEPAEAASIARLLSPLPLYLADGHHRYETALVYRDRMRATHGGGGDAAHSFILMGLVEIADPGNQLFSFHRTVSGISDSLLQALHRRIGQVFDITPLPVAAFAVEGLRRLLQEVVTCPPHRAVLGLVDSNTKQLSLLTVKSPLPAGLLPPAPATELYQCETWLLHEALLRPVLGGDARAPQHGQVEFVHGLEEVARALSDGGAQLAFLVRPMPLQVFEALVRAGQRLPPKTTYFHPKLPTGFVLASLEGEL
ncbi:MAG: DUF1015 domain-containing protein [Chloroflexi bacterium]|nr:DUF1015 domain-containing protein [Chloroflexota bacterium]